MCPCCVGGARRSASVIIRTRVDLETPCGADAFEKFQDSFVFSRGASAPSEMQCGSSYNSIVLALRAPL